MPILSPSAAADFCRALHASGKRLVFTSGCFDILHAGHVRYLQQARQLGDALCIALNSDASVRALKGPQRPINHEQDRAEVLLALRAVDVVVIFDDERTTSLIRTIAPQVFAKGGDYTVETLNPEERTALISVGAQIEILPEVKGKSTTATIAKMHTPSVSGNTRKPRIGVLGSGAGSNCQALIDAISAGDLQAEITLILSDKPDAGILTKAAAANIPHAYVDPGESGAKLSAAVQQTMCDKFRAAGVDLIVLAGFMRILGQPMLHAFPQRIINIHPSLLPAFPGKDAIPQALAAGVSTAGCTVHYVDAGIDTGSIITQSQVPVVPEETLATLTRKIQLAEHALLPVTVGQLLKKLVH
jgi:formyltetrahydrofolate-dependent phosphoribosylglycinamide formyltransferase